MYLEANWPYIFKTGCGDGATADYDTYLELFDVDGNRLAYSDDNRECGNSLSKLEYTPTETAYYYLVVRGFGSATGSYTLAYRKACKLIPDYDYDLTTTTTWQTYSGTTMGTCNNKIIYRIAVTSGQQYIFKTGCGNGATANFDIRLWLYDGNGNELAYDDDGCESVRSKIEYTATYSGYVYLIVGGYSTGTYTLAYRNVVPRTITISANPTAGLIEEDSSRKMASTISIQEPFLSLEMGKNFPMR